jgi:hypothetical protein
MPQYIFARKFRHLFFDADIGSSDSLISAVKKIAIVCFGFDLRVEVFASSNSNSLTWLEAGDDWPTKIKTAAKLLRQAGDYGGLVLVEVAQKWAVYQERPIDVGVFALNSNQDFQGIGTIVKDNFFDSSDIAGWISGRDQRDIDLVKSMGRDYLIHLMKNYS